MGSIQTQLQPHNQTAGVIPSHYLHFGFNSGYPSYHPVIKSSQIHTLQLSLHAINEVTSFTQKPRALARPTE